jgi:hypothetical protein
MFNLVKERLRSQGLVHSPERLVCRCEKRAEGLAHFLVQRQRQQLVSVPKLTAAFRI